VAFGCGSCGTPLSADDVDLATGIARCRRCRTAFDVAARSPELASRLGISEPARPARTRVVVSRVGGGDMAVIVPASATRGAAVTGVAVVCLAFAGFWTMVAWRGGNRLTFVSIFFWVLGLVVLWLGLRMALTKTAVYLKGDTVILSRRFLMCERNSAHPLDLAARAFPEESVYSTGDERIPRMHVVLPSREGPVMVGESMTAAEAAWLAAEINRWMAERRPEPSDEGSSEDEDAS
jgi:hypothetical protein